MAVGIPDQIGDRMKASYEDRTRYLLPRRTYTILRVDGKAFHTYTRHHQKPFDPTLERSLDDAAIVLSKEAHGCKFAYGQSDEYSFLLTDFETVLTQPWFDGNIQKICSVAASTFTAAFNASRDGLISKDATFDCRVFTIPDPIEVENYFIWRQQDCVRNSILGLGFVHFSPKQMHGLNCAEIQEKLFQEKSINWNDTKVRHKRGRMIVKRTYDYEGTTRSEWMVDEDIPTFTASREYLIEKIPQIENRVHLATTASAK